MLRGIVTVIFIQWVLNMKRMIVSLFIPVIGLAQVQESISPIVKHDENKIQFTLTSQNIQQVVMSLDDMLNKKKEIENNIAGLQAALTKINKMITDSRALGVKTDEEIEAEKKAVYDAMEAERAAKVTVKPK